MQVLLFILLILSLTANSSAFFDWIFNSKDQCPIKLYNPKDSSFTGVKIYANKETFHPLLETLSKYAKQCHVTIRVKRAVSKADLTLLSSKPIDDRKEMAFLLGEAIEFELFGQDKKLLCNTICLGKSPSFLKDLPDAQCFLKKISEDSNLKQDNIKHNVLFKRSILDESFINLRTRRNDLQEKCRNAKIDA